MSIFPTFFCLQKMARIDFQHLALKRSVDRWRHPWDERTRPQKSPSKDRPTYDGFVKCLVVTCFKPIWKSVKVMFDHFNFRMENRSYVNKSTNQLMMFVLTTKNKNLMVDVREKLPINFANCQAIRTGLLLASVTGIGSVYDEAPPTTNISWVTAISWPWHGFHSCKSPIKWRYWSPGTRQTHQRAQPVARPRAKRPSFGKLVESNSHDSYCIHSFWISRDMLNHCRQGAASRK